MVRCIRDILEDSRGMMERLDKLAAGHADAIAFGELLSPTWICLHDCSAR